MTELQKRTIDLLAATDEERREIISEMSTEEKDILIESFVKMFVGLGVQDLWKE